MNIPANICREILLRLPAVCLLRFRSVSKGWCSVIDDPFFIKAHTNHQLSSNNPTFIIRNSTGPPFCPLFFIDLDDLNFTNGLQTIHVTPLKLTRRGLSYLKDFPVAACNGLILIAPLKTEEFCYDLMLVDNEIWEIWNPLTQERLKLPQPNIINSNRRVQGVGLGYDCAADDYKVVVIDYEYDDDNGTSLSQTHVYSLRSDSWRIIGSCPFDDCFHDEYGVFLSGALYWVSNDRIIVFDVGTESYRQLALPSFDTKRKSQMRLEVLSGCLFLSCESYSLWVMNDYGGKYTWTNLIKSDIISNRTSRPVSYMKNKRRVLLRDSKNKFAWFDAESKTLKKINIHGISGDFSAQVFVGSLVRIHVFCGRRVAAAAATTGRTRDVKMAARTKLTFCVREYHNNVSHDNCHGSFTNWYHSSNLESIKVCGTSFDPDGDSASTLPSDIIREIFVRLPAKAVIQLRAVCKDWKEVIDDPCFEKSHTNKQLVSNNKNTILIRNKAGPPFHPLCSFDLDELDFTKDLQKITVTPHEFMGSRFPCLPVAECNGLMLVDDNEKLQLWNPLTNEHLELPQVHEFNSNTSKRVATGLGYEQATNDYKVVVIHRESEERVYRTHVYSLRSDSWKTIAGDQPLDHDDEDISGDQRLDNDDEDRYLPQGRGVFLYGALHWFSKWQKCILIFALDLMSERYRQIQGPPLRSSWSPVQHDRCFLDVLGDCLIVTHNGSFRNDRHKGDYYDVWVMKEYGAEDSWIKLTIEVCFRQNICGFSKTLRPLTYMKNNTQILLQDEKRFYLFDMESKVKNVICIHGLAKDLSSQIFAGSIFRLHNNCGVGGKRRKTKRKSNMKRPADTELYFCARHVDRDHDCNSHDSCYIVDSNLYCSSSETED